MSTLTNVRVYANRKYVDIYRGLRSDRPTSPRLFPENKDIFLLCCALGFKFGVRNKIEKREDIIRSNTFDPDQETLLKLIALRSEPDAGFALLDDSDAIIRIAEEYADKGMEILVTTVLSDYVNEREDGTYTLVYTDKSYLQKELFHFVDSNATSELFA